MERDDIIRLAREAHRELVTKDYPGHAGQLDPWTMRLLERFAALVAAHEREECAKECETLLPSKRIFDQRYYEAVEDCVATIRARGEK